MAEKARNDSLVSRTLFIARAYSELDLDKTERVLEEEIRRESTVPPPDCKFARMRHHGEMILHSKHVLMIIVVLNLVDCALVLGELVLDIHYIKELREHSEVSSVNFIDKMQQRYPEHIIGDFDVDHMDALYGQLYHAKCTWGDSNSRDMNYSAAGLTSHSDVKNHQNTFSRPGDDHSRSERATKTTTTEEYGAEYNVVRNRTTNESVYEKSETDARSNDREIMLELEKHNSSEVNDGPEMHNESDTNHEVHSVWMDIAHGMHKTSICILGILFFESILKVSLMGRRFFIKKLEVFDVIVVVLSFTIDLVFLKGLSGYKVQDALLILSFLLPWRVIRVVNSLIVAVLDHEHFRLKMLYQEKKVIAAELKLLKDMEKKWDFHLHKIEKFCQSEGIPKWKIRQHTAMGRKQSTITSMASLALNSVLSGMMTGPDDYALLAKSVSTQDSTATNLMSIDEDESSSSGDDVATDKSKQLSIKKGKTDSDAAMQHKTSQENNNNGIEKPIHTHAQLRTCPKDRKRVSFDKLENRPLLLRQLSVDEMQTDGPKMKPHRTSSSCADFNGFAKHDDGIV